MSVNEVTHTFFNAKKKKTLRDYDDGKCDSDKSALRSVIVFFIFYHAWMYNYILGP